jgi:HK97 family phage portal protein
MDQAIREWMSGRDPSFASDIKVTSDSALRFSAVFGCLRVLAETFASASIFEYKKNKDNDDREKTNDTGLLDVLKTSPNPDMSGFNFREMAMYQINTGGNFFAIKSDAKYNKGTPVELNPLDWKTVTVARDPASQRLTYTTAGTSPKTYTRENLFHVPGPSVNGIIGMSPIEYAAQAIRLGMQYEQFGIQFYKNGAIPSGVFQQPTFLKDEAWKRLKEDLRKNYQGLLNAGTPLLLEDGLQFKELTMKLADAQLLECKKFQIEDICRIYRVPLHLVQNLDRATNNNIEQQSLEFVMYTMLPHFKRWEDCINHQLLTSKQRDAGYYLEFNISSLLRGDSKSMADAFAVGRQWGWLSVNDIRRMLNMNSVKGGGIYLTPLNMQDVSKPLPEPSKPITLPVDPAAAAVDPAIQNEIQKLIEARA